jgi:hypothetical protein
MNTFGGQSTEDCSDLSLMDQFTSGISAGTGGQCIADFRRPVGLWVSAQPRVHKSSDIMPGTSVQKV